MMKTNRFLKEQAFSVLEMVMVFAVIIIALSFLLPALRNVREKGRSAVCVGNLKQLHKGIMLYTVDHEGWIPAGVWWQNEDAEGKGIGDGGIWDWEISPYVYKDIDDSNKINTSLDFLCPQYVQEHNDYSDIARTHAMTAQVSPGFCLECPSGGADWRHLDSIEDPSNCILLAPVYRDVAYIFNDTLEENAVLEPDKANCDWTRHKVGANYLFVDGSVRFMTESDASDTRHWTPV